MCTPLHVSRMGYTLDYHLFIEMYLIFYNDWLILRHKSLHNNPSDEVGNGADTEDNHISSWFAVKSHKLECTTLSVSISEEHT